MSRLVIKGGRVVDPAQDVDRLADIAIEDGVVREIGPEIEGSGSETFDARGLIVAPGFIDMHVHLREPGFEHAETDLKRSARGRGGWIYFDLLHAEYDAGKR